MRNLFGSFTLLADRPFVVGETVQIGGEGLGIVERVGLRSTTIRTVEDTVIVVPNSNLTTMNITNFGRRRFRRFTTRLGVVYGTPPERLTDFRDGIRQLIHGLKWTRKDQVEVAVNELAAAAIELEVSVYFDVSTRHEEVAARERCCWAVCAWPKSCMSSWRFRHTRRRPSPMPRPDLRLSYALSPIRT